MNDSIDTVYHYAMDRLLPTAFEEMWMDARREKSTGNPVEHVIRSVRYKQNFLDEAFHFWLIAIILVFSFTLGRFLGFIEVSVLSLGAVGVAGACMLFVGFLHYRKSVGWLVDPSKFEDFCDHVAFFIEKAPNLKSSRLRFATVEQLTYEAGQILERYTFPLLEAQAIAADEKDPRLKANATKKAADLWDAFTAAHQHLASVGVASAEYQPYLDKALPRVQEAHARAKAIREKTVS